MASGIYHKPGVPQGPCWQYILRKVLSSSPPDNIPAEGSLVSEKRLPPLSWSPMVLFLRMFTIWLVPLATPAWASDSLGPFSWTILLHLLPACSMLLVAAGQSKCKREKHSPAHQLSAVAITNWVTTYTPSAYQHVPHQRPEHCIWAP